MVRQGTVTSFAVDVGVLAGFFHVKDVRMAGLAGLVTGEMDRTGGDLGDRSSAVVSVLAKALRHNEVPDHQEHCKRHYEQEREPEEVSCIFEEVHRIYFSFPTGATGPAAPGMGTANDNYSDRE